MKGEEERRRGKKKEAEEVDDGEEETEDDDCVGEVGLGKEDEEGETRPAEEEKKKVGTSCPDRKCVPGILYVGHIPPRLRPKHLRNLLSPYGEIGRIFLQPEDSQVKRRRRRAGSRGSSFTEGWVEFRDKRLAKRVAAALHSTPMGSRKHHCFHADLWCLKYLHRFQWTQLNERLAYERSVLKQRLRAEVSLVKRETSFILNNVEKSERRSRWRRGEEGQLGMGERSWQFTQRQTEEEIQFSKRQKVKNSISQNPRHKARVIQEKSQSNVSLLAKIFKSSS